MLSEIIESSRLRNEYTCHKLNPRFGHIISLLKEFESNAGQDYYEAFDRFELKKGDFLLRAGQVSTHLWFLEEGIARLFTCKEEDEITGDFFFASDFIDLYSSSRLILPAASHIQLLTDAKGYAISWEHLRRLKRSYPILGEIENLILACYFLCLERRNFELQSASASERYKQLIYRQPYLLKQIPLSYIASFLGISLETLSRIRKKLLQ